MGRVGGGRTQTVRLPRHPARRDQWPAGTPAPDTRVLVLLSHAFDKSRHADAVRQVFSRAVQNAPAAVPALARVEEVRPTGTYTDVVDLHRLGEVDGADGLHEVLRLRAEPVTTGGSDPGTRAGRPTSGTRPSATPRSPAAA